MGVSTSLLSNFLSRLSRTRCSKNAPPLILFLTFPNDHAREPSSSSRLQDDLRRLPVVVPPVPSETQSLAPSLLLAQRTEQRLHPVGQVVLSRKLPRLLAQARGACLLSTDGARGLGGDFELFFFVEEIEI